MKKVVRRIAKGRGGLTLVELMVVMVVLALGIIPIALVQTRSNRDVFETGQRTEALSVARMQMEQTRSLGFANAVSDSGQVGVYTWRSIVAPQGIGMNSITVTVQWQEGAEQRSTTLRGLISTR